jgi:hypothetical protein
LGCWDLIKGFISDRITISRLGSIRTDVRADVRPSAGAGVGDGRESIGSPRYPRKTFLDNGLAIFGVGAEPGHVPVRTRRDTSNVSVGVGGQGLGASSGEPDHPLVVPLPAADVGFPFAVDAGDSEVTREVDLSSILNSGVQVLRGPISIDVSEEVRWLDGVVSSARPSEVVRSGDW